MTNWPPNKAWTSSKSIYGFTKYSSEELIKEYMYSEKVEYIINRCGLISGPGNLEKLNKV